jgi:hypothetical protein
LVFCANAGAARAERASAADAMMGRDFMKLLQLTAQPTPKMIDLAGSFPLNNVHAFTSGKLRRQSHDLCKTVAEAAKFLF